MSMQDSAKNSLLRLLVKWVILGAAILAFRFLRWGGVIGLLGIGLVAASIWLLARSADANVGGGSLESIILTALAPLGVGLYILGIARRRRRSPLQVDAAVVEPNRA